MKRSLALTFLILCFATFADARSGVDVKLVTDEADSVLKILEKRSNGSNISDADWDELFRSEGYVRLKKREASIKRPFDDADFRRFVLSDDLLARYQKLRSTVQEWKTINIRESAGLALAYLPASASIKAKVYPVIKPRDNSFVFEIRSDPAIFLFVDPAVSKEEFGNTLAHELHHVGFGTACPGATAEADAEKLPTNKKAMINWLGAFGEGLAMLAAAGGWDTHPHKFSKHEDREQWDKDILNFNSDLAKVETFFRDILSGRLSGGKIGETGATFYGIQGPWYTVGWKMSAVIEEIYGRERLIAAFCDERKLIPAYNDAVRRYNKKHRADLAKWSSDLASAFK